MVVLGLPLLVWSGLSLAHFGVTGRGLGTRRVPAMVGWFVLALLLGYTLARNLMWDSFDVLRPVEDVRPAESAGALHGCATLICEAKGAGHGS